ncbi:N-acetylmuramic acid 6-phosphate etherase [Companilactobacillus allii]|uniref:N-acetylmuramic acid 6-phosphate etherase n=1 Tax=Companilactobacillus allii TaxID=1847728 RepID=A0A1P8Q1C9_9LACO|nr:N-acetylmuramic acid 6-phosphate etherase [Companilactobacillus allii]APX71637.1 N-acetylmuramic acid 6-phosphate etherase [Companilactobacillus allii]USQ68719.1 N-acetylmuramic acid 6-phosphate etherase [Companilactobacillus allii]
MNDKIDSLTTEQQNPDSTNLDQMSTEEIVRLINKEDGKISDSIKSQIPNITKAIESVVDSFQKNGRLIYMGAGTSGRLGVLDAAECVPTFGTDPEMVQGLIAGGKRAMTDAVEGAEDSYELGETDLKNIKLTANDTVVGIAASGRTPYVIGALKYAQLKGSHTVSLACNKNAKISSYSDIAIEVNAGPEVLSGSTRMKSGTVQKMVLNMISTTSMIKIGKVYKNLMIDVKPTNEKLVQRAKRIITLATGVDDKKAAQLFLDSGKDVKVAIVMALTDFSAEDAVKKLKDSKGFVRGAIN